MSATRTASTRNAALKAAVLQQGVSEAAARIFGHVINGECSGCNTFRRIAIGGKVLECYPNSVCGASSGFKPREEESHGEPQKNCLQVPIWKGENSLVGGGQFWTRNSMHILSKWIGRGHLGFASSSSSSSSSVKVDRWSSCLFARSMSMKGREDRKKKDLARREFQLLRRRSKLLKATMSIEERLLWRLRKSNRKKAILLQRLKKYELEKDPEAVHDPELITPEQLQALKKIGYKNRNYVPVGRRGVYGGVVLNMHMHWKFHETVQVDCHIFKGEDVRTVARQLAILSGGIVIDIHQATTIIMYRGRNYKQPKTEMTPPNTLTKRKALFKSKYLQALEGLDENIKDIEAQLQIERRKQKENAAQGVENETNKPPQIVGDKFEDHRSLANLSDISSDEDDGLFSWESDSLDEDELSDVDEPSLKALEEDNLDKKEIAKPLSWTLGDSAERGRKKKRPSAKELILAEQELFRNNRNRLSGGAQKKGLVSSQAESKKTGVDVEDNLRTDDEDDGMGIDLEGYVDKDLSSSNGHKAGKSDKIKGYQQIKNKKIAKFVEEYMSSDEDEEDGEFGTDIDDVDEFGDAKEDSMAGTKRTHGNEGDGE